MGFPPGRHGRSHGEVGWLKGEEGLWLAPLGEGKRGLFP